MWALWAHDVFQERMSSIIDRSCFSFSWSTYDICVIQERVRIELRALICPAKVKADACSIGGNTTAHMFIRTQSYVCLFACECVCAQCLWLYAHWLDIEQISWLQIPEHIHAPVPRCLVSCWCRYKLLGLLAIVALFDILFAWYFCYVFYPAWVDRD